MTTYELIAGVLDREGPYADNVADRGGPTAWGITAVEWGRYRRFNRAATRDEMRRVTRSDATTFYMGQLVASSFTATAIPYEPLRVQLFDFGVNSGSARAIRWLQRTIGVPTNEGVLDDRTIRAVAAQSGRLVNNALVAARIRMFHDIVAADASQRVFLDGWINRALSFAMIDPAQETTAT